MGGNPQIKRADGMTPLFQLKTNLTVGDCGAQPENDHIKRCKKFIQAALIVLLIYTFFNAILKLRGGYG